MARTSDGIRLQVRDSDSSRSATREQAGTPVPSEPRAVGVPDPSTPLSADEVDAVFGWATAALLGDAPELDVDLCPRVMGLIRARRAQ